MSTLSGRCLNAKCTRPATQFPEGYGFRFCDSHAPLARQVLDNPPKSKLRRGLHDMT